MSDTIELTYIKYDYDTDEEDEVVLTLPSHMVVCYDCDGHGTHLTPSMRSHAYTEEEIEESFSDEDREAYFSRGSYYDVQCETCHGKNVIPEVDESRLDSEQKRQYAEYNEHEDARSAADAEYRAECEMERRYGC